MLILVRLLHFLSGWLFPVRVIGREHIPKQGKLILCSNHKSVLDPYFLLVKCPRRIYYMAKSELFTDHGRLAGWFLRKMGAFPVHRNSGDTGSVHTAITLLEKDQLVGIFPQGGCVREDAVPFRPKAGAALLAAKAKADILPACISCKGPVRPFHRVTVRFGQVLPYESLGFAQGSTKECRVAAKKIAAAITQLLEEQD